MLKVCHLKKSFNQVEVLKDINFEIKAGQVIAIIGPSGSGKSTLLRCLNFLEVADDGTIDFMNHPCHVQSLKKEDIAFVRKNSAMVFQQFNLFRYKNVLENVMEGLIVVQKKKKAEAKAIAQDYLAKVGMDHKEHYYPRQLSGGQKQRVGIARALALHPKIILFDEPTSALDPEMVGEVLDVIRIAKESGHTMIIVSHEMNFVSEIADEVIFLDNGYIIEQGTPQEIFHHPKQDRTRQFLSRVNIQGGPNK